MGPALAGERAAHRLPSTNRAGAEPARRQGAAAARAPGPMVVARVLRPHQELEAVAVLRPPLHRAAGQVACPRHHSPLDSCPRDCSGPRPRTWLLPGTSSAPHTGGGPAPHIAGAAVPPVCIPHMPPLCRHYSRSWRRDFPIRVRHPSGRLRGCRRRSSPNQRHRRQPPIRSRRCCPAGYRNHRHCRRSASAAPAQGQLPARYQSHPALRQAVARRRSVRWGSAQTARLLKHTARSRAAARRRSCPRQSGTPKRAWRPCRRPSWSVPP